MSLAQPHLIHLPLLNPAKYQPASPAHPQQGMRGGLEQPLRESCALHGVGTVAVTKGCPVLPVFVKQ